MKKRLGYLVFIILLVSILASSCETTPPLKDFKLTVITNTGTGTGTVTSSPAGIDCGATCSADYQEASEVVLTASSDADSSFGGWSDGCIASAAANSAANAVAANTCTVTMDAAKTVTASFTKNPPKQYQLNIKFIGTGTGTVKSEQAEAISCTSDCNKSFEDGSKLKLMAIADSGSTFVAWSQDCTADQGCELTMDKAHNLTVEFKKNPDPVKQINLKVNLTGSGQGTVKSTPTSLECIKDDKDKNNSCDKDFDINSKIALEAKATDGSSFTHWSGACTGTNPICQIELKKAQEATANFEVNIKLTVTRAWDNGKGSFSTSPAGIDCDLNCAEDFAYFPKGTKVTISGVPEPGHHIVGWTIDNKDPVLPNNANNKFTVLVDKAKLVFIHFKPIAKALTINITGNGQVVSDPAGIACPGTCDSKFEQGQTVTLTATPDAGWSFTAWSANCAVATANTCTTTMDAAKTVTATFSQNMQNLIVTVTGSGKVSSSPAGITDCTSNCNNDFVENTVVTLTATPDAGGSFTAWSSNCAVATATTCTTNMDAAKTVTATFSPLWHKWLGSSGSEFVAAITTDSSGNVYLAGGTSGALFGETNAGSGDVYLVKYNAAGTKQWHKWLGSSGDDRVIAITTDSSGNVYLAGRTTGALFGETNAGNFDGFLVKYNTAGTEQWHKWLGSSNYDEVTAITTDSSGNVYLAGRTRGALFGEANAGSYDVFLVKYNAAGTEQWHKWLSSSGNDEVTAITTDSSGNVYLAGHTNGALFSETNAGSADGYLVKYNAAGTKQWHQWLGSSGSEFVAAITTDSSGNVYLAGVTTVALFSEANAGDFDGYLVKYNTAGTKQWHQWLGSSGSEFVAAITTDSSGNVYLAGGTSGALFGETNAGGFDEYLVKYNAAGTKQWHKWLGSSAYDEVTAITTDSSDNVYLAERTNGALFGETNAGGVDVFLVKYNAVGNKQWHKWLGSSGDDYVNAITTDSSGNVYLVGSTEGALFGEANAGSDDGFLVKY